MARHSLRIECGRLLVEAGRNLPHLVVLEADLKESTQSVQFQRAFPDRYFDVGIAEQNMVGMAAGLALAGKLPVVHSFAPFIALRACEQVRTSVAYPRLNVKFVATHAGLSTGSAGTTHHAVEDLAVMRAIPHMTVLAPGDLRELRQAVAAALSRPGPVYIRLGGGEAEDVYTDETGFAVGRATLLREGGDVTLVTTGMLMHEGRVAADELERGCGLSVRHLQMASLKPLDEEAVRRAARETRLLVTLEEHNVLGGLGGAVCEVAAEVGGAVVRRLGVRDRFAAVGSAARLLEAEGLTAAAVVAEVRRFFAR